MNAPSPLSLYRGAPFKDRLHLYIRWLTCPFRKIAAVVPSGGKVLEIGCGHGLFCLYLSLLHPELKIHGVDIDGRKVELATGAAEQLGNGRLSFSAQIDQALDQTDWDAIIFIDVLYLIPTGEQEELLARASRSLAPGGKIVIKEMAATPPWKAAWNKFQETLAVKMLVLSQSKQKKLYLTKPASFIEWLTALGARASGADISRGYLHPHYLIVAEKASGSKVRS